MNNCHWNYVIQVVVKRDLIKWNVSVSAAEAASVNGQFGLGRRAARLRSCTHANSYARVFSFVPSVSVLSRVRCCRYSRFSKNSQVQIKLFNVLIVCVTKVENSKVLTHTTDETFGAPDDFEVWFSIGRTSRQAVRQSFSSDASVTLPGPGN